MAYGTINSTTGNYYSCGAIGLGMNGGYAILSTGNGAAVFGNGCSSVATWNGSPSVTFPGNCPSQAGMYTMNYAELSLRLYQPTPCIPTGTIRALR